MSVTCRQHEREIKSSGSGRHFTSLLTALTGNCPDPYHSIGWVVCRVELYIETFFSAYKPFKKSQAAIAIKCLYFDQSCCILIFVVFFNSASLQRFQGMEAMIRAKMLKEIHLTSYQVMVMNTELLTPHYSAVSFLDPTSSAYLFPQYRTLTLLYLLRLFRKVSFTSRGTPTCQRSMSSSTCAWTTTCAQGTSRPGTRPSWAWETSWRSAAHMTSPPSPSLCCWSTTCQR